jgi:tetratricopeptide (TPR) repeat protein
LGTVDAQNDTAGTVDSYIILRAANLAEAIQHRSAELAQSYTNLGFMLGYVSHSLARAYFRRAQGFLGESENLPTMGAILIAPNWYALGIADWQAAERGCARALEICERLGDRKNWFLNFTLLGYVAYSQGQFERSLKLFTDCYQEALATNHFQHQAFALAGQAWLSFRTKQPAQVIALAESILPMFALSTGLRLPESATYSILSSVYVRQGQFDQARQAAATAGALMAEATLPVYSHAVNYGHIAEVYLTLWEKEQAQKTIAAKYKALARQACQSMHRLAHWYPVGQPGTWRWQGVYDWLDGKPRRARQAWLKSLAAAQKLAMPYDEALAYYEIGRHAEGEERQANLARAREIIERLGVGGFDMPLAQAE